MYSAKLGDIGKLPSLFNLSFSDIIYYLAEYGEQHKEIIQPELVTMLYKVYVTTNNLVIKKNRT